MPTPHCQTFLRKVVGILVLSLVMLCASSGQAETYGYGASYIVQPGENLDFVDEHSVPSAEFRVGDRWNSTATNASNARNQGDPLTVTWGFIPDGSLVRYNPSGDEPANNMPSDLLAMLNGSYGASTTGDVQDAPWFRLFDQSFGRWSELSGVTYEYESADGGAALDGTSAPRGQRGVYADVRIGGRGLDGSTGSNTLAFNYFPDHGDMVIDTDNASFYANRFAESRRLRNVVMHEAGHGLGFNHLESSDSGQLMEPFISTAFDGPQIDDILAAHRNYGDALESNGGNDRLTTATEIGVFDDDAEWIIGTDGRVSVVANTQTDFVSIDGRLDRDYYRFTVTAPGVLDITLSQVGRTYSEGPQDGDQTPLNTSTLNPLEFQLISSRVEDGVLVETDGIPLGRASQRLSMATVAPGFEYYVLVNGTVDNVQLYELGLDFTAVPIPEPGSLFVASLACLACVGKRRAG